MNLYLDTEFNSFGGALISLALVDEKGNSFYTVLPLPKTIHPWVAANVIPVLHAKPLLTRRSCQEGLEFWLRSYSSIHVVADWPEDIKHFMDLLITGPGTRIDTPRLTCEVRRDLNSDDSLVPHNALSDAWAIGAMDNPELQRQLALQAQQL